MEVAFNKKSAITKENLHTKYSPFTYNDVALNEKPSVTRENLHILFFVLGGVECTCTVVYVTKIFQTILYIVCIIPNK